MVEVLASIALALIIWYGGNQALQGTVSIGVIAAFLQYARRFFRPIQDLSEKYNILQGAMASSERIFGLLDEPPGIEDPPEPLQLDVPIKGRIAFENVWFRYLTIEEDAPDNSADMNATTAGRKSLENHTCDDAPPEDGWVLRGINLEIKPGERMALVGATGAGKTTLFNLLMLSLIHI